MISRSGNSPNVIDVPLDFSRPVLNIDRNPKKLQVRTFDPSKKFDWKFWFTNVSEFDDLAKIVRKISNTSDLLEYLSHLYNSNWVSLLSCITVYDTDCLVISKHSLHHKVISSTKPWINGQILKMIRRKISLWCTVCNSDCIAYCPFTKIICLAQLDNSGCGIKENRSRKRSQMFVQIYQKLLVRAGPRTSVVIFGPSYYQKLWPCSQHFCQITL